MTPNAYAELARSLESALALPQPPIAVSFADAVPPGVPVFDGQVPAGCRFWQDAARGPFATSTRDHELCAIGVHTHHLAAPPPGYQKELSRVLEVMAGLDYVRPEEVAGIPVLPREVRHVVYAPLAQAPLAPDVVLLFAHARQSLVLTEALGRVDGDVPAAMGRPACAALPAAVNSGHATLSLGCCGARAYLDALDDSVAMWALPGRRLAEYVERIVALAHANQVLGRFHQLRRRDVEAGGRPTIDESLARLGPA